MKETSRGWQATRWGAVLTLGLLFSLEAPAASDPESYFADLYHLPNLDASPHLLGFGKLGHDCEADFFSLFMRADASVAHLDGRRADLEIEVGDMLYRFDSRVVAHPQPPEQGPPTLAFLGHAIDPDFFPLAEETPEITVRITGPIAFLRVLRDTDNRFSTEGLTENRLGVEMLCRAGEPDTAEPGARA